MQYGVDISTYKRLENRSNKKELRLQKTPIKSVAFFIMGFLLSRVLLSVTIEMGIAPFGIAYLIGIKKEKSKDILLSLLGIIMGYLSIYRSLEGAIAYCIVAVIVMGYIEICNNLELKQRDV
ncbi:stage II sporulation protein E, partial [Clostridium perfringens]|nr:stage II sporulation protein E [Clostridium perfringens]